jgi:hypothetical protein
VLASMGCVTPPDNVHGSGRAGPITPASGTYSLGPGGISSVCVGCGVFIGRSLTVDLIWSDHSFDPTGLQPT